MIKIAHNQVHVITVGPVSHLPTKCRKKYLFSSTHPRYWKNKIFKSVYSELKYHQLQRSKLGCFQHCIDK